MNSWECHKCGYVWALSVTGCENCNKPKAEGEPSNSANSGVPWWKY